MRTLAVKVHSSVTYNCFAWHGQQQASLRVLIVCDSTFSPWIRARMPYGKPAQSASLETRPYALHSKKSGP